MDNAYLQRCYTKSQKGLVYSAMAKAKAKLAMAKAKIFACAAKMYNVANRRMYDKPNET